MKGQFYIVGVGPGAPDLLTLRALRILEKARVICVPKGKSEGSSVALSIIEQAVPLGEKEVLELHFPMKKIRMLEKTSRDVEDAWLTAARAVQARIEKGLDTAFPTLGDPSFFSTAYHLMSVLGREMADFKAEVVPGVSSISAAASSIGLPVALGDERIAILPATYEEKGLRETLRAYDTVVFMKIHKALDRILDTLQELNLLDRAFIVERASMAGERMTPASRARGLDLHYFSTMIVRRN